MIKVCARCGIEFEGRRAVYCPDCREIRAKEYQRRWREANRDKLYKRQRRWREANRDKVNEYAHRQRERAKLKLIRAILSVEGVKHGKA